uniref:Transmembrane protein 45B n=1 Tax=Strigamia maritima TaxID=126957 RepID=T1J6W1_STRMM
MFQAFESSYRKCLSHTLKTLPGLTMTTFLGHVYAGVFEMAIALWWTYSCYKRYYKNLYNGKKFLSSSWFPVDKFPNYPLESIVKFFIFLVGFISEIPYNGISITHIDTQNIVHVTIYWFVLIQSLVEILQFYKFRFIPPSAEYFTFVLAFIMHMFIFAAHIRGKSELNGLLHSLLALAIAGCAFTFALEAFIRDNFMVTLARCTCMLVQGTWIIHLGFILFPPIADMKNWAPELDHMNYMVLVMFFSWHIAVDTLIVFLFGKVVISKSDIFPVTIDTAFNGSPLLNAQENVRILFMWSLLQRRGPGCHTIIRIIRSRKKISVICCLNATNCFLLVQIVTWHDFRRNFHSKARLIRDAREKQIRTKYRVPLQV